MVAGAWLPWLLFIAAVGSMLAVQFAPTNLALHRIERPTIIGVFIVVTALTIFVIIKLVADMLITKHGYPGVTLLETSIEIWTANIVIFALFYWQLDSGSSEMAKTDFWFDKSHDPNWSPRFVDYFYMAFATSTSFVPPDYSRPSSSRAKVTLMLQATISLVTLALVASRAISTL